MFQITSDGLYRYAEHDGKLPLKQLEEAERYFSFGSDTTAPGMDEVRAFSETCKYYAYTLFRYPI